MGILKLINTHVFKTFIALSIYFTNTKLFLILLKYVNYLLKGRIQSFFIFYASKPEHFKYYLYDWVNNRTKWKLFFCGFHKQNGKYGIHFAINADESELISNENHEKFSIFLDKNSMWAKFSGIQFVNYAGILPSVINKRKLASYQSASNVVISEIMLKCIRKVCEEENIKNIKDVEFYILGGQGFIGKEVVKIFKNNNLETYSIDMKEELNFNDNNKIKILLNVSRRGVIEKYKDKFNSTVIIVNEVFPDPKLSGYDIRSAYHIKGVEAENVFPALPNGYDKSLPCCGLVMSDSQEYSIVLKKYKL